MLRMGIMALLGVEKNSNLQFLYQGSNEVYI